MTTTTAKNSRGGMDKVSSRESNGSVAAGSTGRSGSATAPISTGVGSSVTVPAPTVATPASVATKIKAPTATPIAPAVGTASPYYSRLNPDTNSSETKARSVLYDVEPFDETKARKVALKNAGDNIRSIEDVYEDKKNEERKLGQTDLARANTISALQGFSGSPTATTRQGNSERKTADAVQAVDNQKAYALQQIYDKIDANVEKEKEAAKISQKDNAKRILDDVAVEASNTLNSFASEGVTWDALEKSDPTAVATLVRQTGKDAFSLQKIYEDALPADKKPRTIFEGFKGDNFVSIKQNADGTVSTKTYDKKELGLPEGLTNPTSITLGNDVYWYDSEAPLGKDGKPNLIRVGSKEIPKGGTDSDYYDTESSPQSFEEYVKQISDEKQQSFDPAYVENTLRPQYDALVKEDKTKNADLKKNYTAQSIPNAVKNDLIHDIKESEANLEALFKAYPDVSSAYVTSTFNALTKKKKGETADDADVPDFLK